MNIVILSTGDYAGSGYNIKRAVEATNVDIKVVTIVKRKHPYGYDSDMVLNQRNSNQIQLIINNADIIHFKGDELPSSNWFGINIPKDKKIIITVGGSGFRRGKKSQNSQQWHPMYMYLPITDLRTCITPDLNYPEFYATYTPHTINSRIVDNSYSRDDIIIQHSPSNRGKKGTNNIILPTLHKLKSDGYPIKIELLEGLTNQEVLKAKKNSTIFIDQINEAGFYGMSTIESIQYGIPTFTYVNSEIFNKSSGILLKDEFPIQTFSSEKDLYEKIKYFLENLVELDDLSIKTKKYCDKVHSYETIGKLWGDLYRDLLINNISYRMSVTSDIIINEKRLYPSIKQSTTQTTTNPKNKRYEKNGIRNKVKPKPEKKVEIEKPKPTEPIISKKAIPIKPTKLYTLTEKGSKTRRIHDELTTGRLRKGRGYNPRHKKR